MEYIMSNSTLTLAQLVAQLQATTHAGYAEHTLLELIDDAVLSLNAADDGFPCIPEGARTYTEDEACWISEELAGAYAHAEADYTDARNHGYTTVGSFADEERNAFNREG